MKATFHAPRLKYSLFDVYMMLLIFMTMTSLMAKKLDGINKILFLVIFFFQVIILFGRLTKKYLCLFVISVFSYIVALMNTENLTFGNMIVYYMNWILFSGVMVINKDKMIEWIKKNEHFVVWIMRIWTAIVIVSVFLPSGYYIKEGGGRYFGSFAGSTFRLAPIALFIEILALVAIVFYNNKKYIVYMIMPLFSVFMGGSRTYLAIIAIVFLMAVYMTTDKMRYFVLKMVPVAIGALYVYQRTSISEKVAYTMDSDRSGDFLYNFTSSRSELWSDIMDAIESLTPFEKVFGAGFWFTDSVTGHYAHNDFLEILATHGIIGVVLYIIAMWYLFKAFFKGSKAGMPMIMACVFLWFFNAIFNMFYTYTCTVFSFPFLLVAVTEYGAKKRERKLINREVQNEKV